MRVEGVGEMHHFPEVSKLRVLQHKLGEDRGLREVG
jgi:hypothetical protein